MTSPNRVFSIDFESERMIKAFKQEMLRGPQRIAIRGMVPVEFKAKGQSLIGFTKFEEGNEYDHFRVFAVDADAWVSVPKASLLEIDGRELTSMVLRKYREQEEESDTTFSQEN